MRMLVTGAAGFIGSNFVRWLFEREGKSLFSGRVVVLDSLTYAGNLRNLEGLEGFFDYRFVKGDIRDTVLVEELLTEEKIDTIVNFAAESHVDRSILDPLAFVRTNIEGTQVLINCAMNSKSRVERFLQISTDEVYGSLGSTGKFTESSPIKPSSAYAASKTGGDLLAIAAYKTHNFPVLITRCSNNYGSYQFPEKLIPLFVTNALTDQPLPLYGDGKNIRNWIHVDDHSSAIYEVLTKGKFGEVYNIGGGEDSEWENVKVTQFILNYLKKPETLVRHVEDRKGHDRRYAVDFSKIKNELGWEPKVRFEDGLAQTIDWYLENTTWWQEVKSGEYQSFYQNYYGDKLN
jgi:dTDP-glucose 4,6-dehydratase